MKIPCPYCNGTGDRIDSVTEEGPWYVECEQCGGEGVTDDN